MLSILICHSYFLRFDSKQQERAKPYPPLATLQVASMLRKAGHEVSLFDAMLAEDFSRFGRQLEPYRSTGDAIATWPTTASSVGVRYDGHTFVVCAPFGLADLLSMVARANKTIVTRDVYEEKVARWAAQWPQLTVIPGDTHRAGSEDAV